MAVKEGVKARPLGGKRPPKKKVCPFCVNKVEEIDYIALAKEMEKSSERSFKDGEKRTRYITEIYGDNMQLLGRRGDQPQSGTGDAPAPQSAAPSQPAAPKAPTFTPGDATDDLPF